MMIDGNKKQATSIRFHNMLAEQQHHCKNSREFHETHEQQSRVSISHAKSLQQVYSKVFAESGLATQLSKQDIFAWPSLSSLSSSLSTGSLFSLSDSFTMPTNYISTGILFNNLDLVPVDADVDPMSYVCFNCWQIGHKHRDCPEVKILYCRNCGRRGVHVEECPRCARSYHDFLCKLNKQYQTFFCGMETSKPKEVTKTVQDIQLKAVEEKSDECWDDFVEDDCKTPQTSYSDSQQKKSIRSECNHWDDYQSPRLNLVEKSSKVYSLIATKEEVEKLKDDSWDDFENDSYSYQCGNNFVDLAVTNYESFIIPEEEAKSMDQYQGDFSQGGSKDFLCGFDEKSHCKSFHTLKNQKAEHESECWSNHDEGEFKSSWEESAANSTNANLIEGSAQNFEAAIPITSKKSSLEDENDTKKDLRVEDVFRCPEIIKFKEDNSTHFMSEIIRNEKYCDDLEAFASLEPSFCEETKTENLMTSLHSITDEDYWTDFDDDYSSLSASFADEYKSLNTTADDDDTNDDCTNIVATDAIHTEENPGFYEPFYVSQNKNSNWKFSYIKTEVINNQYAAKQTYEKNTYQLNSLESSINGESDLQKDIDEYEDMVVDEDERSEPVLCAGQAVQEFLKLLDSLKHLPIYTQNLAVLHFISKHRDQSW